MAKKQSERGNISLKELYQQRRYFHRAPNATGPKELPLLEKQALIDEILRGMPIPSCELYREQRTDGMHYMVTKGWAQIRAIIDFRDDKFKTWTEAEMRQWQQSQKRDE